MEKRSVTLLGVALIAGFGAMYAVNILLTVLLMITAPEIVLAPDTLVVLSAISSISCVPILWLVVRKLPLLRPAQSDLSARSFLGFFLLAMGATYIFNYIGYFINSGITYLLTGEMEAANPLADIMEGASLLSIFLYMCVIAPIVEEIIFRKILFDRLRPFGDRIAILYTGLAFGLFHMNLAQAPYAIAIGLILGYTVVRTGRIRTTILLHAFINIVGAIVPTLLERYDRPLNLPSALQPVADAMAEQGAGLFTLLFSGVIYILMFLAVILFFVHRRSIRLAPPPYRFTTPLTGKLFLLNWSSILYLAICAAMMVVTVFLERG